MAAMRELVAREQHIALRATTGTDAWTDNGRTDPDVSADGHEATAHEAAPTQEAPAESDPLNTPSADTLALNWRRWWRRMTGSA
jgi:hypothetical protein